MKTYEEMLEELLSNPELLKKKQPFTRGEDRSNEYGEDKTVGIGVSIDAVTPSSKRRIVSQGTYLRELDPACHDVLFDENIPSLCVKLNDGGFRDIKFTRMALPIQKIIKNKQLLHLTGNPMQFTLLDTNPTEKMHKNFTLFKQYWDLRNQDGMKNKMVETQLSVGDAGLLFYFDRHKQIKSRIISYRDGYVLCPHNDENGDRLVESIYYKVDNVEYIDSYDDRNMTRWTRGIDSVSGEDTGWVREAPVPHGFDEIPLITKRGEVAWEGVQTTIESFEILYNIFNAIQRRHGWGMLYIKGKFKQQAEKINGSVILNDTNSESKGDAKYLTPPSPQGTIDTLSHMLDMIQLGSSTTFILPKDLKTGGDLAGITVQLVQSLDIQNALQKVISWQNVADKMGRLFKFGLAKELASTGENPYAVTEFKELRIGCKFKVWRPMNENEFNNMVATMKGSGIISKETAVELNTLSKPDEKQRIIREEEENAMKESLAEENPNNITTQEDDPETTPTVQAKV